MARNPTRSANEEDGQLPIYDFKYSDEQKEELESCLTDSKRVRPENVIQGQTINTSPFDSFIADLERFSSIYLRKIDEARTAEPQEKMEKERLATIEAFAKVLRRYPAPKIPLSLWEKMKKTDGLRERIRLPVKLTYFTTREIEMAALRSFLLREKETLSKKSWIESAASERDRSLRSEYFQRIAKRISDELGINPNDLTLKESMLGDMGLIEAVVQPVLRKTGQDLSSGRIIREFKNIILSNREMT